MNKKQKKIAANAAAALLLTAGAAWVVSLFVHVGGEYTNNAQVQQHITSVHCRVQGFIKDVRFGEFQEVHRGDTLVTIDDSEYLLRLAQAEADEQNAMHGKSASVSSITAAANNLHVSDAGIRELEVLLANAESEHLRYKNLMEQQAATRQQYDAARTHYEAMRAKLEAMHGQRQTTTIAKEELQQRSSQQDASVAVCRAARELARLNLSYTIVTAPCDGTTSQRHVQQGQLVQAGMHLVSIVDSRERWVIANYRETQCRHIQVGSHADIRVDAFPSIKFDGVVSAIASATGAQFSAAPHDNSIGNFVKTEQRIPVKIVFTDKNDAAVLARVSAGMNVECIIRR